MLNKEINIYQLMHQQSEKDQKKINQFYKQHPIGQRRAELLRQKLHKSMCTFFYPFKQYYDQYRVEYILAPNPTYIQKEQFQDQIILSAKKQGEYLRGATPQYFQEDYIESLINEQAKDKGLVQNIQNRSIFIDDGLLMYASGCTLRSLYIQLGDQNNIKRSIEAKQSTHAFSLSFPELILELALFSEQIIIIRCRYWIFLYHILTRKQVGKVRMSEEITTVAKFQGRNILMISTFSLKENCLYEWDINKNSINLLRKSQSFWGIHSLLYLNPRQFVIGFNNKIIIQDLRSNHTETLKRVHQIGNDRFCNIAKVCGKSNEMVLSRSKFIDVFDIRNPQFSLLSIRHKCQQSPPSCLISLQWQQPILVAYSPSRIGSCLLINIDTKTNIKNQQRDKLYVKSQNKPMLIYDSGKHYPGLYVKSVCAIISENILKLIHFDSSDGICLEQLKRSGKTSENIIHLRPSNNQVIIKYPEQPGKKLIQLKQVQPYLDQYKGQLDPHADDQSQVVENQSQFFKRINNYCSLDSFRNRLHELAKNEGKLDINLKQGKQFDTYVATLPETEQDQNWAQILKYANKTESSSEKVTEQLLDFMQRAWQI